MAANYAMRKEREISRRLLLASIGEEGATRAQIEERTGMHFNSIYRILKALREDKTVRVSKWINRTHEISGERLSGQPFAVYSLNPDGLPDAPKNKRLSPETVGIKYRQNRRIVTRARTLAKEGKSNMWDQLRYAA
jgi:hypothetical protein